LELFGKRVQRYCRTGRYDLLGEVMRNLGLAYALTGDPTYVKKATQFLYVWAVDPATRRNPGYENSQSLIELSITMPGIFYGADLIYSYTGWDSSEKTTFLQC
jgi:hypothetical protein